MAARPRILLVEDDPNLAELVRYNLEREDFEVETTPDGEEALLLARETPPDLVVLDWMIESLSGIEVCRRLRRLPETANVPIIMLTARVEEEDRIRGLETGADDYITKPFSPRELAARVSAVLRRVRPALAGGSLSYADIEMDTAAHRVRRGGKAVPLGADRVSATTPFSRTSRPRLLARAAARRRVGPGHRHRASHRGCAYPPPAQGDQRQWRGGRDPDRPVGGICARRGLGPVETVLANGGRSIR